MADVSNGRRFLSNQCHLNFRVFALIFIRFLTLNLVGFQPGKHTHRDRLNALVRFFSSQLVIFCLEFSTSDDRNHSKEAEIDQYQGKQACYCVETNQQVPHLATRQRLGNYIRPTGPALNQATLSASYVANAAMHTTEDASSGNVNGKREESVYDGPCNVLATTFTKCNTIHHSVLLENSIPTSNQFPTCSVPLSNCHNLNYNTDEKPSITPAANHKVCGGTSANLVSSVHNTRNYETCQREPPSFSNYADTATNITHLENATGRLYHGVNSDYQVNQFSPSFKNLDHVVPCNCHGQNYRAENNVSQFVPRGGPFSNLSQVAPSCPTHPSSNRNQEAAPKYHHALTSNNSIYEASNSHAFNPEIDTMIPYSSNNGTPNSTSNPGRSSQQNLIYYQAHIPNQHRELVHSFQVNPNNLTRANEHITGQINTSNLCSQQQQHYQANNRSAIEKTNPDGSIAASRVPELVCHNGMSTSNQPVYYEAPLKAAVNNGSSSTSCNSCHSMRIAEVDGLDNLASKQRLAGSLSTASDPSDGSGGSVGSNPVSGGSSPDDDTSTSSSGSKASSAVDTSCAVRPKSGVGKVKGSPNKDSKGAASDEEGKPPKKLPFRASNLLVCRMLGFVKLFSRFIFFQGMLVFLPF